MMREMQAVASIFSNSFHPALHIRAFSYGNQNAACPSIMHSGAKAHATTRMHPTTVSLLLKRHHLASSAKKRTIRKITLTRGGIAVRCTRRPAAASSGREEGGNPDHRGLAGDRNFQAAEAGPEGVAKMDWENFSLPLARGRGKIAVVGAGVSGLAACKALKAAGFEVSVFESRNEIGGIWSATYSSTSLQTPRSSYCFSDHPWPPGMRSHPYHHEVISYLESYVARFGLADHVHLGTRVAEMRRTPVGGWQIRVQRAFTGTPGKKDMNGTAGGPDEEMGQGQWLSFAFVVMCSGCFGDVPRQLSFPPGGGPQVFGGTVLHSVDYSRVSREGGQKQLLGGRRVVVVGFQKTGIDIAIEVADANAGPDGATCTLLFRRPHWTLPKSGKIFGVPLPLFFLTRFSEFWAHKPRENVFLGLLRTILPVRWAIGKLVEFYLLKSFPLRKFQLVPPHDFMEDLSACILPQMPAQFYPLLEAGRIRLKKTAMWHFTEGGIALADGTEVAADVVLLCTGYDGLAKLRNILPPEDRKVLAAEGASIFLYRGVVHPQVPGVAFLGFHEGLSSVQTAEMGARWLGELLRGSFRLPPAAVMEGVRQEWREFKLSQSQFARRVSCIAPDHFMHFDALCEDMGWAVARKRGWFANLLLPHTNRDYCGPQPAEGSNANVDGNVDGNTAVVNRGEDTGARNMASSAGSHGRVSSTLDRVHDGRSALKGQIKESEHIPGVSAKGTSIGVSQGDS